MKSEHVILAILISFIINLVSLILYKGTVLSDIVVLNIVFYSSSIGLGLSWMLYRDLFDIVKNYSIMLDNIRDQIYDEKNK